MNRISGFPIIQQCNIERNKYFNYSHDNQGPSFEKFSYWCGHKVLTFPSIPLNVAGVTIACVGMIVTACTIAPFKVLIYAATGQRPQFSTGFVWFGERGVHSVAHLVANTYELSYDSCNALYLGYRLIRWIGRKLNLEQFFNEIFRRIQKVFDFMLDKIALPLIRFSTKRLEKGFIKTLVREGDFTFNGKTPKPYRPLDNLAKKNRIDWKSNDRPWNKIFKHYFYSVPNVPLNASVAAASGIASVITCTAFTAKVILYATTSIDIPVPTFVFQSVHTCGVSVRNVYGDLVTGAIDPFIMVYKVSNAIGLNRVVKKAIEILFYIPEALFN